jgi:hypothetical protein
VAARILLGLVCVCGVCLSPLLPQHEAARAKRRLISPPNPDAVDPALRKAVTELLADRKEVPDPAGVRAEGARVFVRILPSQYVLNDKTDEIQRESRLGPRPFVFLTVPEALYGKSLEGAFAAVGYSAEDAFLKNRGKQMAAAVFTYPEGYRVHPAGEPLPEDGWDRRIYPTTWNNLFDLTERMVRSGRFVIGPPGKDDSPTKLSLTSEAEKNFVLGYPRAGKDRLRRVSYAALKQTCGADWEYRQMLERCWGASEHFTGDGRTKLAFGSAPGVQRGFPEFVGPNITFGEAGTLAVIYLGKLEITE